MIIKQAKVWKINESHVITIPYKYIKTGIIKPGQRYTIDIEVQEDTQ